MNRLKSCLLVAALALVVQSTAAQPANAFVDDANLPFGQLGPYPSDRGKVYEFFLFGCPYCRAHSGDFEFWGRSLPDPIRFSKVPIPTAASGMQGARAWYAVKHASAGDPQVLARFEAASYSLIQDRGASPDLERTYREAARQVGIDSDALDLYWRSPEVKRDLIRARQLFERYRITNTPSLAIGGRFVVHAEYVGGDYALLFRLANGLVSQMLLGDAHDPAGIRTDD